MTLYYCCSYKSVFGFTRATFCCVVSFTQVLLTRPRHKSEMSSYYWVALKIIIEHFSKFKSKFKFKKEELNLISSHIIDNLDLCLCNVWIMSLFKLHDQFNIHKSTNKNAQLVSCSHCRLVNLK